jgi:hypothetical protein
MNSVTKVISFNFLKNPFTFEFILLVIMDIFIFRLSVFDFNSINLIVQTF